MCPLSSSSPPLQRGTLFEGEAMGLLELVNFLGGGSDLIASSSWEKISPVNVVALWRKFSFALLSRSVLGLWLCVPSAE